MKLSASRSTTSPTAAAVPGRQVPRSFRLPGVPSRGRRGRFDYLLFLPAAYGLDPSQKWPLILFLHGMGETGAGLKKLKVHGIPKKVDKQPDFPFITVSPQCPYEHCWFYELPTLNALLDEVVAAYAVDARRVYLTGLSMGGYGAWALASRYPERFAAVVPVCGGGDPAAVSSLKDVPVWAFHGALDEQVSPGESQRMVDALKACGGAVRFTLYPDLAHDSWTRTYDDPALYHWLLQQRKTK
ncbi:MAG: alpha/beta fold hydrolase [Anaerolineae bacterium]|nr:alpha/beta fold hydrolase [Anaerolineae bacterium]